MHLWFLLLCLGVHICFGANVRPVSRTSNGFGVIEHVYGNVPSKSSRSNKIVGGTDAAKGDAPWQVAMLLGDDKEWYCGGTLLSKRVVITAAHCISSTKTMTVGLGGLTKPNFEQYIKVKEYFVNPDYTSSKCTSGVTRDCSDDIAVLILDGDAKLDTSALPSVQVAKLPKNDLPPNFHVNQDVQVSGWGVKDDGFPSTTLRKLDVKIVDQATCAAGYEGSNSIMDYTERAMICAGSKGHDAGSGDSGGPLVNKVNKANELLGVVSFGNEGYYDEKPGVYTRVSNYVAWINAKATEAGFPIPSA